MLTQIQRPWHLTMLTLQRVSFDSILLILRSDPACKLQYLDVQGPVSVSMLSL